MESSTASTPMPYRSTARTWKPLRPILLYTAWSFPMLIHFNALALQPVDSNISGQYSTKLEFYTYADQKVTSGQTHIRYSLGKIICSNKHSEIDKAGNTKTVTLNLLSCSFMAPSLYNELSSDGYISCTCILHLVPDWVADIMAPWLFALYFIKRL